MRRFLVPLFVATLMVSPITQAAEPVAAQNSVKTLFLKPLVLRGTLGDAQIQATIRTKDDFEDGVEGEYFYFGRSQRILLAGEIERDELLLEESENGTDVSGQWTGVFTGGVIAGEWQSADGKITKPFTLRLPETAFKDRPAEKGTGRGAAKQ